MAVMQRKVPPRSLLLPAPRMKAARHHDVVAFWPAAATGIYCRHWAFPRPHLTPVDRLPACLTAPSVEVLEEEEEEEEEEEDEGAAMAAMNRCMDWCSRAIAAAAPRAAADRCPDLVTAAAAKGAATDRCLIWWTDQHRRQAA